MQVTPFLRRLAAHDADSPLGLGAAAALCVAFGAFARFVIEPVLQGQIGYATYFPAVIVSALWAGRRAGVLAIALSVCAVWAFVPPYFAVVGGWTLAAAKVITFSGSAGVLVLAAGAFRDAIRELDRKLATEAQVGAALRASEARFKGVFDSGAVGVAVVNMAEDARPLDVNARFLQIAGIDRAVWDAGGWSWRDATPAEDLPKDEAAARALLETGLPQTFEKVWMRPDGSRVPIVLSAALMPDAPGLAVITVQDITEAKRTEEALRESEERFRVVADSSPAFMWMSDEAANITFANRRYRDFFGVEEESMLGDGWRSIVHPEDVDGFFAGFMAAFEKRETVTLTTRVVHPKEGVRWLQCTGAPRFASDGRFLGYVGINLDVSQAKAAEEALQQNEARLLLALQAGRMIAWDSDLVTGEFRRSSNAEELLGEAELPDDFYNRIHPDDRDADRDAVRRAIEEGEPYQSEYRYPDPNGGWLWLHNRAVVERDESGRPIRFVGVAVDVTARRDAEAAQAESEARFRSIANTAPAPIWVTGPDGVRRFVNDAYCTFVGRPYEAALKLDWREVLHPEDALRVRDESIAGEASGEPFSLLGRYRNHAGEWRWLRSYSRPREEAGEAAGFVGVAFDVTEAVEAEAALRESEARLEERIAAALAEKEQAEAALLQAQKLEAVGRLTGGVAHDFNNLLTVVIGSLDSILKRGDDPVRRTRMAEAALQAARRGERLTQQLLAFARRQALRPEVVDLGELVRESEALLRRAVGEAVGFEVKTASAAAWTKVDPAQFEAALLNLVVNARDATAAGGRIVVDVWERRFGPGEVGEGRAGDYVCVEVADTGAGMAPEVLARVFEPFFTTKPVGKGTGLGLAQVYGFARQSGGDAEVFSVPGQGTRVALRLPRVAAPAPSNARESVAPAPRKADGTRVLVVEDDPAVGVLAESLLVDAGCRVTRVETAEPALLLLREGETFDVLLTDVVMPGGVNGVELARQAAALRPDLRIVLTSGYVGEALDGALGDAPWPLLRKPYTAEQLVEAVGAPALAAEPA